MTKKTKSLFEKIKGQGRNDISILPQPGKQLPPVGCYLGWDEYCTNTPDIAVNTGWVCTSCYFNSGCH